jgi:hypothetical protein
MATAVVDLPDPLQAPPVKPAEADGATDDLLSAMVGDEIDRLLAEADAKPAPKSDGLIAAEPAVPTATPNAFDTSALDTAPLPTDKTNDDPPGPTLAEQLDDILSSVDSLIDAAHTAPADDLDEPPAEEISSSTPAENAVAEPAPPTVIAAPPPADASPAVAAVDPNEAFQIDEHAVSNPDAIEPGQDVAAAPHTDTVELPPLEITPPPAPVVAPETAPHVAASSTIEPKPVEYGFVQRLLVRILEFINKPFVACPTVVRHALGKAAVATLINAAAILLYVRWIHLHH